MKIYTFNPVIYPRMLWICIDEDCEIERLKKRFDGVYKMSDDARGECGAVYDNDEKKGGVMIRFKTLDEITFETVAHEAVHAAMYIYDYIDCKVEIDNSEHLCYLVGWIADCCNEVRKSERKEKKER